MAAPGSVDSDPIEDSVEVEEVSEASRAFGRYVLRYRLASGGMASVYLARATGPGGYARPAALKLMHPHLARRKRFVEMFLDEAKIAAQISHPNVCTVLDFGEVDGTYYIAMEYLAGVSLSRLLRRVAEEQLVGSQRWTAMCARIIADAAEGLHAAHSLRDEVDGRPLNVVHRDVSPQNLFVTFDGAVKVVDFGVARAERRLTQTRSGTLKGKLSYMAPEHAQGDRMDRRADVWSLGVCLWEGLTGRRLFRTHNEMDTLLAVQTTPIEPPSSHRPELPDELDRIALRALERDVELRYGTARELSRDLSDFVRGQPHACGLPELEELLGPLFGAERQQTRERLRTVVEPRSGETPSPRPPSTASLSAPPRADAEPAERSTEILAEGEAEGDQRQRAPEDDVAGDATVAEPARATRVAALGAGAAVVLAAGLGLVWAFGLGAPRAGSPPPKTARPPDSAAAAPLEPSEPASAADLPDPETRPEAPAAVAPDGEGAQASEEPPPRRRRARRRARPAVRSAGRRSPAQVVITARPYARVRIDGRDVGNTPRPVTLSPGTHRVQYQFRETGPWRSRTLRVGSGEERALRLTPP